MPAVLEVDYFNTFLLKKVVDNGKNWGGGGASISQGGTTPDDKTVFQPIWPGSDPAGANVCGTNNSLSGGFGLGFYPTPEPNDPGVTPEEIEYGQEQEFRCWFVEESRIRGGFNNVATDFGVKAYISEDKPDSFIRNSTMIYSGVFNSRTNVNESNQFPSGEDITKTADPHYGSLQKLYAEDGNLVIFQENKVSRALIDKDAVYSAEGAPMQTQSNVVIGQITPYVGEYGISRNPESFAVYGYRKYFTDKDRGVVLRLSRDGMTEISNYGMSDYFRDSLSRQSDIPLPRTVGFPLTPGTWPQNSTTVEVSIFSTNNGTGPSYFRFDRWDTSTMVPQLGAIVFCGSTPAGSTGYSANYLNDTYIIGVKEKLDSFGSLVGYIIELNKPITPTSTNGTYPTGGPWLYMKTTMKPLNIGGYDIHNKCYTVSIQRQSLYQPKQWDTWDRYAVQSRFANIPPEKANYIITPTLNYSTLSFDDGINGWTSFYTYAPSFIFSLKDNFYSLNKGNLYKHYCNTNLGRNYQIFYNKPSDSSVTFLFNPEPSINKNFLTINYEGDNGWEVDAMVSGAQGYQTVPKYPNSDGWDLTYPANLVGNYTQFADVTARVRSNFMSGYYTTDGDFDNAGFKLKENKYVANLINISATRPSQVIWQYTDLVFSRNGKSDYGYYSGATGLSQGYGASSVGQDEGGGWIDPNLGLSQAYLAPLYFDPRFKIRSQEPGNGMSGIKGYFATVRFSVDGGTDPFGRKELFAVGSTYQISSR